MTRTVRPKLSDAELDDAWNAGLRGERDGFQAAVAPYLDELLRGAKREIRYRVALGEFDHDDFTPEGLVGEILIRAWQQRHSRPSPVRLRTWLLALLCKVAQELSRRESRRRRVPRTSLEAEVPPEPIYNDDEEFWEWYQPDEMTRWEDVIEAPTMTPEEEAETDEELTHTLDPRARAVFLLCELHRVPLKEATAALNIPLEKAVRLLAQARRDLGLGGEKNLI
jgi:RNA polymerase sigma factor (sigma-70 family)